MAGNLTIDSFRPFAKMQDDAVLGIRRGKLNLIGGHEVGKCTPQDNAAVRQALAKALENEKYLGPAYRDKVKSILLGDDVVNLPLEGRDVKRLLSLRTKAQNALGLQIFDSAVKRDRSGSAAPSSAIREIAGEAAIDAAAEIDANTIEDLLTLSDAGSTLARRVHKRISSEAAALVKTLKEAYALSGDDLATEKAAKKGDEKIRKAADALFALETSLRDAINGGTLRQSPGLLRLMDYCAARASEIMTVWCSARDAAQTLAGRTLRDAIGGKAAVMHGNEEFVSRVEGKTREFESRIVELKSRAERGDSAPLSPAELEGLGASLDSLSAAIKSEYGNVEESLYWAMKRRVDAAIKDLKSLSSANLELEIKHLYRTLTPGNEESERCFGDFRRAIAQDGAIDTSAMGRILDRILDSVTGIKDKNTFDLSFRHLCGRAGELCRRFADPEAVRAPVSPALAMRLVKGEMGVGTVLGAHVHGFSADTVDPTIDDRFLVSEKALGSGAVNSVLKLQYRMPDGTMKTRVFKDEETARAGLGTLLVGLTGFEKPNRIAEINIATHSAAERLGFAYAAPRSTVGVHDGKIGFFMELASGEEARKLGSIKNPDSPFHPAIVLNLQKEEICRRAGSLARETCKIEWIDWATGQLDRHGSNYMVGLDDSGMARAYAIDNDGAFMSSRIGLRKFLVDTDMLKRIKKVFENMGKQGVIRTLSREGALTDARGGKSLLDLDKIADPEILSGMREIFGFNSLARPRRIPAATLAWLESLGNNYEEAARSIMKGNFGNDQIAATAQRLKEMREYAAELEMEGRVMEEEDWEDAGKLKAYALEQSQPEDTPYFMRNYFERDFGAMTDQLPIVL